MQEEPHVESTREQVVEQLPLCDGREKLSCLDLHRDPVLNEHIESEEADRYSSIENLDRHFLPCVQSLTR